MGHRKTDEINEIVCLYREQKKSRDEIEDEYGVNQFTLKTWIYRSGAKIWDNRSNAQRKRYGKDEIKEMLKLYRERIKNRYEIAAEYNVCIKTINNWLRREEIRWWDRRKRTEGKKAAEKRRSYFKWKDMEKSIMYNYNR